MKRGEYTFGSFIVCKICGHNNTPSCMVKCKDTYICGKCGSKLEKTDLDTFKDILIGKLINISRKENVICQKRK